MSCKHPIPAVRLYTDAQTGKDHIKILPQRVEFSLADLEEKYGDRLLLLPCGKCAPCISKRRKDWSVRCSLEAQKYKDNCFVTLTYDDSHKPPRLLKSDLQQFIKRVRNAGFKVRYFGAGELGNITKRPHYHIILFGFFPSDAKSYGKSSSGFDLFTSQFLSDLWNKGFVTVQQFTGEVASYTAGYTSKKLGDGEGFLIMSTRPGIGREYFEENYKAILENGCVVTNFGSHIAHVPRYCEKVAEDNGYDVQHLKIGKLAASRLNENEKMNKLKIVHREELYEHDAKQMQDKLSRSKRRL